jgi:Ca2+-binding RTX toxin-like protein
MTSSIETTKLIAATRLIQSSNGTGKSIEAALNEVASALSLEIAQETQETNATPAHGSTESNINPLSTVLPGPGPWYLSEDADYESFLLWGGINTTIYALGGNDTINAYGGAATIYGGAGNDSLFANGFGAYLDGGDGNDTLRATGGRALLVGGDGNDTLDATNTADDINVLGGGAGDDVLRTSGVGTALYNGGDGNDQIYAGDAGSTSLMFGDDGNDGFFMRPGVAFVFGGAGIDLVNYQGSTVVSINLNDQRLNAGGAAGQQLVDVERFILSNLGDIFVGADATDEVYAWHGNDFLQGNGGSDLLYGNSGDDTLLGGDGDDHLVGGTAFVVGGIVIEPGGNDILYGGNGNDFLAGEDGNDLLYGGAGLDSIVAGDGDDTILIASGDTVPGEVIYGGAGFDRLLVYDPNADLSVVLISGIEEIVLSSGVRAVTLGSAQLADVERITQADGSGQPLIINAASAGTYSLGNMTVTGVVTLNGSSGTDTLIGSSGDDTLNGNAGNDVLDGADGNDVLDGGAGADTLTGGNGFDTASYRDATAAVGIDLTKASSTWTGDAQGDFMSSIEAFELSEFADTFRGDATANTVRGGDGTDQIFGNGGDDSLTGGAGNDTIQGGDGNDVVRGDGWTVNPGDDYIQGNAGDDILQGDGGNDRIVGGIGNDTLVGGLGGDYLAGSEGVDIFRYLAVEESQNVVINGVSQQDQIADFTQGQDKIDLSAIDANPTLAGNQAFTFIADPAHYTGSWAGVVWQTINSQNGIVTLNVSIDGDADPEMQIYMSHPYQFTASDFIL